MFNVIRLGWQHAEHGGVGDEGFDRAVGSSHKRRRVAGTAEAHLMRIAPCSPLDFPGFNRNRQAGHKHAVGGQREVDIPIQRCHDVGAGNIRVLGKDAFEFTNKSVDGQCRRDAVAGHVEQNRCMACWSGSARRQRDASVGFRGARMHEEQISADLLHRLVNVAQAKRPRVLGQRQARLVNFPGAVEFLMKLSQLVAFKPPAVGRAESAVAPPAPSQSWQG